MADQVKAPSPYAEAVKIEDSSTRTEAIREIAEIQVDKRRNPEKYEVKEVKIVKDDEDIKDKPEEKPADEVIDDTKPPEDAPKEDTIEADDKKGAPDKDTTKDEKIAPEEETERLIEDYAKRKDLSKEEVEKEVDDVKRVFEKYGGKGKVAIGDANYEIIKANLSLQRTATKAQMAYKELKQQTQVQYEANDTGVVWEGKFNPKADLITAFREKFPNDYDETVSDEKVYDKVKQFFMHKRKQNVEDMGVKIKEEASDFRNIVLNKISNEDTKFAKEVKEIFAKYPDEYLTSHKDYILDETLRSIRGDHYHEDIKAAVKEAKEEGMKLGKEDKKLLGERQTVPGSTQTKIKGTTSLSESGKQEAEKRYGNHKIPKEKMWELYERNEKKLKEVKERNEKERARKFA